MNKPWRFIFIFIIVSLVAELLALNYSLNTEEPVIPANTAEQKTTKTPVPRTSVQTAKEYTQLVQEYDGRRIQFDAYCQAFPHNVTYKTGTRIMLDNRSGDARYVSVGGVQYYLAGYGYKIITLSSAQLPKTMMINCGAAVNVGQILLQK